jgi:cobalt/nickel transport system permease protein
MHISDGVLMPSVSVGSYAVSVGIMAMCVRKMKAEELPKVAVVTSSFFVASLIHIPLGPTSVHLLIIGLVGALLGVAAFPSVALGLTLQSLLFGFGGITALGANALMMGVPALIAGWVYRRLKGQSLRSHMWAGAMAGGLGTALAAVILALLLMTSGEDFFGVAKVALAAHAPVIIIEAAITAFTVSFLMKVKPELVL